MPEGNETHRWAALHGAMFAGKRIRVEGPNGRFDESDALNGRVLRGVRVVGKHLGYDFGANRILHVHMGLYGKFVEGTMPHPETRGALRLRMSTKTDWLELRGPTDCSVWTELEWTGLLARLGPDPLSDADGRRGFEAVAKRRTAIGLLLMDQTVFSGTGNVYRAELLFRARVSPFRAGCDVSRAEMRGIWKDARVLMPLGVLDRRMVTTRLIHRPHRRGVALDEEMHYVYRRNGWPCRVCGAEVLKADMAGRNLFWCPVCQAE